MPEEEKPKKKNNWIWIIGINVIIFLMLLIVFLITRKLEFWKPLLLWMLIIAGIEFIIFIIYFAYKYYGKKAKKDLPFLQIQETSLESAKKAIEKYAWDEFGIKKNRCTNYISAPRVVKLDTGQAVQTFIWYFKELVSIKRKEYAIITLVDNPKIIGHEIVEKKLTREDIANLAKEIATQKIEIEHTKLTRTDQAGNIITEEYHKPMIPEITKPKEAGKL